MGKTVQLSTLIRLINDIEDKPVTSSKSSFLTKALDEVGNTELLEELKGIKSGLNLLPHTSHEGGGGESN